MKIVRLKLETAHDRDVAKLFTKVSVAMADGFLNLNPLCTLLCLFSLRQLRLQQS